MVDASIACLVIEQEMVATVSAALASLAADGNADLGVRAVVVMGAAEDDDDWPETVDAFAATPVRVAAYNTIDATVDVSGESFTHTGVGTGGELALGELDVVYARRDGELR